VPNRWWIYQRERFPLLIHGPLIAAFAFAAVSLSSLLRGRPVLPSSRAVLVAFVSSLICFLQLRVADEFKDAGDDARYRAYRPVPRGLVTLGELTWIGLAGALLQLGLSVVLAPRLVLLLVPIWLYMGLMRNEFFVPEWLKARPLAYLGSHMLIVPLIHLYATACDWLVEGATPPPGLGWFLLFGFFNGIVIEVGRKIRAPEEEEPGVETYSALWGRRHAVAAWVGATVAAGCTAILAVMGIGAALPVAGLLGLLLCAEALVAWRFLRRPIAGRARFIEPMSGLWVLLVNLSLGGLSLLVHA
jgi:hypothetical protein